MPFKYDNARRDVYGYMYFQICIFSIRRRALDLLYGMCDVSNAKDIVEELLQVFYELDNRQSHSGLLGC